MCTAQCLQNSWQPLSPCQTHPSTHFHSHRIHSIYTLRDRMCACHMHSSGCYHVKQQCIFLVYCSRIYFNVLKPLCINVLIVFILPVAESVVVLYMCSLLPLQDWICAVQCIYWTMWDHASVCYCTICSTGQTKA